MPILIVLKRIFITIAKNVSSKQQIVICSTDNYLIGSIFMAIIKGLEWTFNTEAEKYEKMRPGYVYELYEDIFEYISIDKTSNVVEVGIGGGQATLPVLRTGCKLTAVEYGTNLAEICRHKFKEFSNFKVITTKFEDFEYDNNLFDLIYSASAFHWIPEDIGYTKVFEMLNSGGVFARFANHPYKDKGREEVHEALQKIYSVYLPGALEPSEYSQDDAKKRANIARKYGFVDISYKLYYRTRTFTAKEYINLLGTYSDHIAIEEKVRIEFLTEIENVIDNLGGQITIYDTIDLQLARKPFKT
jgi:ubiquinone/menaquinone biosynthesis C-methylase UbiE